MTVEIASHRKHKNFDIVKFKGLYHINDVEKYRDFTLKVTEDHLADLEDGEFYYHEIIGLDVYENDILIGQVEGEFYNPVPMMFGLLNAKEKKICFALHSFRFIVKVDVPNGRIDVTVLEGLDDEN